jgi:site-specific DNA-methyltransferase (adenine-specific)
MPEYSENAGSRYVGVLNGGKTSDSEGRTTSASQGGRWPANIIHDGSDEVLAHFPDAPGQQRAVGPQHGAKASVNTFGDYYGPRDQFDPRGDSGSAARFFYCAKTSASERHIGCEDPEKGNVHPTVKPVDLMRYLTRLVTPKGGTVLDPFAGSGSTLIAASWEGFRSIGCELSPEYLDIASRRLTAAQKEIEDSQRQLSMFTGEGLAA